MTAQERARMMDLSDPWIVPNPTRCDAGQCLDRLAAINAELVKLARAATPRPVPAYLRAERAA